MIKVIKHF